VNTIMHYSTGTSTSRVFVTTVFDCLLLFSFTLGFLQGILLVPHYYYYQIVLPGTVALETERESLSRLPVVLAAGTTRTLEILFCLG
jgi:hypothetical protein